MIARTLKRTAIVFVIGFLALFALRFAYSYVKDPIRPPRSGGIVQTFSAGGLQFAKDLRNYASTKVKFQPAQVGGAFRSIDQKYEKIANVGLRTLEFEKDETKLRTLIKDNSALIQFEQRQGLKRSRSLRLAIGVNPEKFDPFVAEVRTIGKVYKLTIDKSDKTNEYRDLQAKRASLETSRKALTDLKQREGDIAAMVELEKQILKLEQAIQALGVSLGDFDVENEFVTVKVLLAETRRKIVRNISIWKRLLDTLFWTLPAYAMVWLVFAAAAFTGLVATFLMGKVARMVKDADRENV
ncbi:MAG: DUF4349 domain-containing protein [Pseudomonadota bacterium]